MEATGTKKKNRGENWNAEDKLILKDLVKDQVSVIENKNTDTNTNRSKQKAWDSIQKSFNEMVGTKRTIPQLKTQWTIIKMSAKKEKARERQELFKTGGGPKPAEKLQSSDDISAWLPNEFAIDCNEFDSDANQQQIQMSNEDIFNEPNFIEEILEEVEVQPEVMIVSENDKSFKCDQSGIKKIGKVKSKKRKVSTAQENISAIAECDMKCREELHSIQMQNEIKKSRNLDLKHEVLLEKLKFYRRKNQSC